MRVGGVARGRRSGTAQATRRDVRIILWGTAAGRAPAAGDGRWVGSAASSTVTIHQGWQGRWGAGRSKISGALDFQTFLIESVFEPALSRLNGDTITAEPKT